MYTSNRFANCPPSLDFSTNPCHTNSMNKTTTLLPFILLSSIIGDNDSHYVAQLFSCGIVPIVKLSTTAWLPLLHLLSLIHANTSNWLLTPTACRCIASWVHPTHAWCWAYWRWLHIRWASWLSQRYVIWRAYSWDSYRRWESFVWVHLRLQLRVYPFSGTLVKRLSLWIVYPSLRVRISYVSLILYVSNHSPYFTYTCSPINHLHSSVTSAQIFFAARVTYSLRMVSSTRIIMYHVVHCLTLSLTSLCLLASGSTVIV